MAMVRCPNCDAENDPVATSGVCGICGHRLDAAPPAGITDDPATPSRLPTYPGRPILPGLYQDHRGEPRDPAAEDDRRAAILRASGGLFAVALVQLICGCFGLAAVPAAVEAPMMLGVVVVVGGIIGVYVALGIWARFQPLPAAVLGLMIYVLLNLAVCLIDPRAGLSGIVVKGILTVVLFQGVRAGIRYQGIRDWARERPPD
jgi:hypothetical protein